MTISIPAGALRVTLGEDGTASATLTPHVRFDVCPIWVELALQHVADAQERRTKRSRAWAGTNEDAKAFAIEREFQSSMQAVTAAATAIDAFYAILKELIALSPELAAAWRRKRTSRAVQVTEVIRRAFHLPPKGVSLLSGNLKEIYRLRGLAVHPPGTTDAPMLHPELNVGIEARFVHFRAHNAELIVNAATWILCDLAHNGKPTSAKVTEYMAGLRARLQALFPSGHPSMTLAST